jgi:hypothetical protein
MREEGWAGNDNELYPSGLQLDSAVGHGFLCVGFVACGGCAINNLDSFGVFSVLLHHICEAGWGTG